MRFNLKSTREEILEENVEFPKCGAYTKHTLSKGQTVTAVYECVVNVSTLRTLNYLPDEVAEIKNCINALYVLYGEKCLKSKFLTRELAKMLPDLLIEQVMTEEAKKYYFYLPIKYSNIEESKSEAIDLYNPEVNATV